MTCCHDVVYRQFQNGNNYGLKGNVGSDVNIDHWIDISTFNDGPMSGFIVSLYSHSIGRPTLYCCKFAMVKFEVLNDGLSSWMRFVSKSVFSEERKS